MNAMGAETPALTITAGWTTVATSLVRLPRRLRIRDWHRDHPRVDVAQEYLLEEIT
jgi:hypothetical protein